MDTAMNEQQGPAEHAEQDLLQLVSFLLAGEEYGIDILSVQEINRMIPITRVPSAPAAVEGVINLRGRVIPVMSLRRKFELEDKQHDRQTRIIVVNVDGKTMGVVVDGVSEVLRIPAGTIQPPPSVVSDRRSAYIRGIGEVDGRLLIFLDLKKIFEGDLLAV